MPWGIVAASAVGGLLSGMAAGDAADAQTGATKAGIAEQKRQFDITQANMKPWLTTGTAANARLAELLGIATPASRNPGLVAPTREQFTKAAAPVASQPTVFGMTRGPANGGLFGGFKPVASGGSTFDQAGYDKAVADYTRQTQASQQNPQDFGSLMKTWTPNDIFDDPGYQFQAQQGEQAVNRAALARGNYFAPSTVQDLLNFNTGLNRSYNADSFNRDQVQKGQKFNMLSGVSGTGQTATTQLGTIGANNANNISNLLTQGGNAQAAGIVGQANAVNNSIGQGFNWYNQGRIMDWLKPAGSSAATNSNPSWT